MTTKQLIERIKIALFKTNSMTSIQAEQVLREELVFVLDELNSKPIRTDEETLGEINTRITKMIMRAESGKKYHLLFSEKLFDLLISNTEMIKDNGEVKSYLGIPILVVSAKGLSARLVEYKDGVVLGE